MHRLNRAEYDNTVRDLFGTALRPARDFPADDFAVGFDNVADALSLSPLHLELYDSAADQLLDELFGQATIPHVVTIYEAESAEFSADNGAIWDASQWILWSDGALHMDLVVQTAGDHLLSVEAFAHQAGDDFAQMAVEINGSEVAVFEVTADTLPAAHDIQTPLNVGIHALSIRFLNDSKHIETLDIGDDSEETTEDLDVVEPDVDVSDRNLIVDRLVVSGPVDVALPPSANADHILLCEPDAASGSDVQAEEGLCAEQVVSSFARNAWRRPIAASELAAKMSHYAAARAAGGSWNEGVRAGLKSVLLSPHFIFRVEVSGDPTQARQLNAYELASRLSYFLWSSMPDDRLFELAESGQLLVDDVLEAEVRRMLADSRAMALADNLGGTWLGIRRINEAQPSGDLFPDFNEGIRQAMADEMMVFVDSIFRTDRSMLDLVNSPTTVIDWRLAAYYGFDGLDADGPQEVVVPGRVGLLGKGGLMAALANPDETNPVRRGKWVLDNVVCDPPPPPEAGDAILSMPATDDEPKSIREQFEEHSSNPVCFGCHSQMDPIGFGLEVYNAAGQIREFNDLGDPIDASGSLTGTAFDGPAALANILAADPRVPTCITEKVATYALGRALNLGSPDDVGSSDLPWLEQVEEAFIASEHRFVALVSGIVLSDAFRWQGPAPTTSPPAGGESPADAESEVEP